MAARILTAEETRRYREGLKKAKEPFAPYSDEGWLAEAKEGEIFFFNNDEGKEDLCVISTYSGKLVSADGVDIDFAKKMINAYMPLFRHYRSFS